MTIRLGDPREFNQMFRLYALLLLLAAAGIFLCLERGKTLAPPPASVSSPVAVQMAPHAHTNQSPANATLASTLARNSGGPLSRLFLQIGAVITAAWILG